LWDFKTFCTRTPIYSIVSNEASYLQHIAPIFIFSIYSVELELHDRKVCFAHLCYGLTRIELSFLENHRSIWVYVIGLELISLTCPGLGLGSFFVTAFMLMSPYQCYGYLILLVWRIGFGVMGMEHVVVMPTVQGFCPVRCWNHRVSYHTQI
jgi:hypothetical protein